MKPRGRPRKDKSVPLPAQVETPASYPLPLVCDFVHRIEKLEDERTIITKSISDIYTQAKEQGVPTHVLRDVVRLRKLALPYNYEAFEIVRTMYMQTIKGNTP